MVNLGFKTSLVFCLVWLIASVAQASFYRIAAYNTANNPDNATEDAAYTAVFDAIATQHMADYRNRSTSWRSPRPMGGSSARLPGLFNNLYGVDSYRVVVSSPDGFFDRTGIVYDSDRFTLIDSVDLRTGFTHPAIRARLRPVGTQGLDDLYVYAVPSQSRGLGKRSSQACRRSRVATPRRRCPWRRGQHHLRRRFQPYRQPRNRLDSYGRPLATDRLSTPSTPPVSGATTRNSKRFTLKTLAAPCDSASTSF